MTATSLQQTANSKPPTPLRGWVSTFYVQNGTRKYGPYFARHWKVGRKIYKQYIKPADLEKVRAACRAYRERRKRQRAKDVELNNLYGNINYLTRIAKRQDKGPLRPADYEHMRRIQECGYRIGGRPSLRSSPGGTTGGSARRAMGALVAQLLALPRQDAVSQLIGRLNDRQSRGFMVPIFTNNMTTLPLAAEIPHRESRISHRALTRIKKACRRVIAETYAGETSQDKWKRWNEDRESQPTTSNPMKIALPDWITEEEIDKIVSDHVANALERKRAMPQEVPPVRRSS